MKLPAHLESPGPRPRTGAAAGAAPVYAMVGNPNCGKTTLFNALTGLRQKVGNYPGVTIEKKVGTVYSQHGHALSVIDLPGAYSLAARSPDEAILRDVLLGRRADTPAPDRIICVVDAAHLERNLYLVHQVLDLGRPVIVVLNMMDMAAAAGLRVDAAALERALGVPVVPCEAVRGRGLIELRLAMSRADLPPARPRWEVPEPLAPAVTEVQALLEREEGRPALAARAEALLLLTDPEPVRVPGAREPASAVAAAVARERARIAGDGSDWAATVVRRRYEQIAAAVAGAVRQVGAPGVSATDRLDAVCCHPVWGWLVFVALMGAMFFAIFSLAEQPMQWIDAGVAALADRVRGALPPGDLRDLLTDGVIAGVGGVVVFLPQILILFLFVGLLESTGYMARAAFLMDRPMSRVGLTGRSFIPLLSGYACAIPGIMATRTIENARDRLVTILVLPLMSCSARLPVYLLMIAMLLPGEAAPAAEKTGLMLLMYALGTGGAFLFAGLFRRFLVRDGSPHMIMELPAYQPPRWGEILRHMVERAWLFLRNAGTIILAISIVLWALTTYPKHPDPAATPTAQIAHSLAGRAGHWLEPAIAPLGFDWRIGIGLITSFAAREVFVSSMGVVFGVEGSGDEDTAPLRAALAAARWPDGAPLFTPLVCFTLMVFYTFALQCMATVAVVKRETASWRWPLFQLAYLTGTAWVVCLVVHQVGRALGF